MATRIVTRLAGLTGMVGLGLVPVVGNAQEALRTAVRGDQAYQTRNAPEFRDAERLQAGPVYFAVGLSYALDWNDNIRLTNENPEDDFIHRPQLDLRAIWPATKDSTLSFGAGVGYQKYMENDDLDRMVITPDSELAWDIPVKDFVFTLYNRFSYSQDVISEGGLSGTAEFPRIENTAGIRGSWSPGRYRYELGYSHYNFFAQSSDFDYLTRSSHQFFGRAAYRVAEVTLVGIEASGSLTDYESALRRDVQSISVGPFAEWQVIESLRVSLRGGYVVYFQDPDPIFGRSEDLSSYYAAIDASHRLTDYITHGLQAVRDVQLSVDRGSDFTEQFRVSYFAGWAFHPGFRLSGSVFYEHATESRAFIDEVYDRFGFSTGVSWQMLQKLSVALAYRFTFKDSDFNRNDYNQSVITLSGRYQF